MLRVGLTGGLGSGKSTVGSLLAEHGARLIEADEIGRQLMQPGEPVFAQIVRQFGREVLLADGTLDRPALGRLAFGGGRIEQLNAIVHPAVLTRQAELAEELGRREPEAILVVESALLFETKHAGEGGWRSRFDCVVLVTAPDDLKVERFIRRAAVSAEQTEGEGTLRATALQRLRAQIPDEQKRRWAEFVVHNDGSLRELREQVTALWEQLVRAEAGRR